MKIALLHYHLRRGGVTRVLESQVAALQSLGHEPCVVAGFGEAQFPHQIVPELDYLSESPLSGADLLAKVKETLDWEPDLWIIHNPSLGKNVLIPSFLAALAQEKTPILLQFHDFAEDGRPGNYRLIAGQPVYPVAEHIHYAFINTRDRDLLIKAGLPANRCHLLPNAVNPPNALPSGDADSPLILYPVRGIRRKNLGELCLLAKHAPSGARFAVTLAPENEAWQPIHNRWVDAARELDLPIEFGVVDRLSPVEGASTSFESWLSHATHSVSTSIAEGFGLSFLEPAFLRRPLIGRDLPEITCDFTSESLQLGTLYTEISVSADHLPQERLRNELSALYQAYGRYLTEELYQEAIGAMIKNGQIDFGNLPEDAQLSILQGPELPCLRNWLSDALETSDSTISEEQLATTTWSQSCYQENIAETLSSITSSSSSSVDWLPNDLVLDQFLSPSRFHFLRT